MNGPDSNPARDDEKWMSVALELADASAATHEVPVGALIVCAGEVIATGYNRPIAANDATAHAEIIALRAATQRQRNYRLRDCTLYVTLEPCVMCAGAVVQARVARVVFAATEPRSGAAGSVFDVFSETRLNHRPVCEGGLLADEAAAQLKSFFRARRD